MDATTPEYALPNSWEAAPRRLALIGECLDGTTRRRVMALGLAAGWRCLEVGGGGGSVATWLAEQVAPNGTVVATDIDTRFLDGMRTGNLDVWRHDVAADPLPENAFDLVHTRSVLMHVPAREEALRRLAAALRPGGWFLLEESDFYPVEATADEPYRSAWTAVNGILRSAGMAPDWARHLPALLERIGLVDVEAEAEVPMFRGGSSMAELMQLSFLQVGDLLPDSERGVIADVVDALADPKRWFPGTAVVGVKARRPKPGDEKGQIWTTGMS